MFQKPNPFPKSVFDNVAYGPRIHGVRGRGHLMEVVQRSLKKAALWDEVKDRLRNNALGLSGGQQQRLCIARAIAVDPEILLMDEPTSALDPQATSRIEDLIGELRGNYTVIVVTHNMQQAARIFRLHGVLLRRRPDRVQTDNPNYSTNPATKTDRGLYYRAVWLGFCRKP